MHGENQAALPNGNLHPYSWMLPRTAGGMSMRSFSSGELTANLIPTMNGAIDFTGQGSLTAEAALVISMACDMAGSGDLTASISGLLNMSVDFEGSGDLSASMSGIANMLIDLEGSGDLDATIAAYGNMEIDIVVTGTGLSTANVGQAVWTALLNQFNTNPDSAAAKLLSAGSAGDPWSTDLPSSYTGDQAGALIAELKRMVERLHRLGKLDPDNPLTVTPTSMDAGDIHIEITGDGETSSTFTSDN